MLGFFNVVSELWAFHSRMNVKSASYKRQETVSYNAYAVDTELLFFTSFVSDLWG